MVVNLGSLLGGIDLGAAGPIIEGALPPQTLDSLFQQLNGILALVNLGEISPLVDKLLQAVTDVIMEATGGAGLYLNLGFNDDGNLEISIAPTNVEVGMFGYQYMTWMESNNLLFAVMSVMSLREWLYIFGAVSVLLAFAAGMCREIKKRIRDDYENKLEAEAAGGEGADVTDGAEDGDDSLLRRRLPLPKKVPPPRKISSMYKERTPLPHGTRSDHPNMMKGLALQVPFSLAHVLRGVRCGTPRHPARCGRRREKSRKNFGASACNHARV